MLKSTLLGLSLLLAMFVAGNASADMIIDSFSDGTMSLLADSVDTVDTASMNGLSGVIGGRRDATLYWLQGQDDVRLRIDRNSSDLLSFAEDPSTRGRIILDYGMAVDLNADLASAGDAIVFRFSTADIAGSLQVTLDTAGVGSSQIVVTTPSGLNNGEMLLALPFSSFATISGSGASFADVDKITILLAGAFNGDYVIKDIFVPEPATVSLLVLGGMISLRRRARR